MPPTPISYNPSHKDAKAPTATAWLVLPASATDAGAAPRDTASALESEAIAITDAASREAVSRPVAGQRCEIAATITNLGAGPSYAGLATFYAAAPADLDMAARTGQLPNPVRLGRAGFSCAPGASNVVSAPQPWVPDDDLQTLHSVLVYAEDLISDRVTRPFDPIWDRHVARRDTVPDFSGHWVGIYERSSDHSGFQIAIDITQTGLIIGCEIYEQLAGGLPQQPQTRGRAVISSAHPSAVIKTYEPQTQEHTTWSLKLDIAPSVTLEAAATRVRTNQWTQHFSGVLERA